MKTYFFEIELEHDPEDGVWEAEIPILPGCAVWAYSREEVLEALREAAKAYLEVRLEFGHPLPPGIEQLAASPKADAVAITV